MPQSAANSARRSTLLTVVAWIVVAVVLVAAGDFLVSRTMNGHFYLLAMPGENPAARTERNDGMQLARSLRIPAAIVLSIVTLLAAVLYRKPTNQVGSTENPASESMQNRRLLDSSSRGGYPSCSLPKLHPFFASDRGSSPPFF